MNDLIIIMATIGLFLYVMHRIDNVRRQVDVLNFDSRLREHNLEAQLSTAKDKVANLEATFIKLLESMNNDSTGVYVRAAGSNSGCMKRVDEDALDTLFPSTELAVGGILGHAE